MSNALFQVGAQANETISVGIGDVRSTALGTNTVATSNTTNGIEVSTRNSRALADGSEIGQAQAAVAAYAADGNGVSGETLTISDADGGTIGTVAVAAGDTAKEIAASLGAVDGVNASAYNQVTLNTYAGAGAAAVTLTINSDATSSALVLAGVNSGSTEAQIFTAARDAINNDATLTGAGVYALLDNAGDLVIGNNDGADLGIDLDTVAAVTTLNVAGLDGVDSAVAGAALGTSIAAGQFNVFLADGYTIAGTTGGEIFAEGATTAVTADATNTGIASVIDSAGNASNFGNSVAAQILNVIGGASSANVSIAANSSAAGIVTAVNAETGSTGVSASATTSVNLSALGADGTVSFDFYGTNTIASTISATVTQSDLSSLVSAINNQTGTTGISAVLGSSGDEIDLTHATGEDVVIEGFTHSAASAPSSSSATGTEVSFSVTGGGGVATVLYDGGLNNNIADSAVVGGTVTFNSSASFNVTTDATTQSATGNASIFNNAVAGTSNTSTLSQVNQVDISTQAGATAALSVLDGALTQVDEVRSDLGAVQNRFESTIASLSSASLNLSAARSRILDADFAAETAALTRAQILQQASVSILSQANAQPQLVLSLLQ